MRRLLALGCLGLLVACGGGASDNPPGRSITPGEAERALPEAGQRHVADVRIGRLMRDVSTIAKGPRHVVEDHADALAAAELVDERLVEAGLEPGRIDVDAHGVTLPVVWAEIPGTQCANRVFVVTGHYDTVSGSPGADDDATGVAAVLEIARVLADAEPGAGVVVAAVPFEESGLPYAGSSALAETLEDDSREVIGMLSAEMLGYATSEPDSSGDPGDYLNVLGYEGSEDLVGTFAAAAEAWVDGFEVQASVHPPETDFISRSDHAAFHARGVPAAFATDGADFRTPYYHQADDLPANIVRPFFRDSVRTLVGGAFAMTTADRDGNETTDACE